MSGWGGTVTGSGCMSRVLLVVGLSARRSPLSNTMRGPYVGADGEVEAVAAGVQVGDGGAHADAAGVVQRNLAHAGGRRDGSCRGRRGKPASRQAW